MCIANGSLGRYRSFCFRQGGLLVRDSTRRGAWSGILRAPLTLVALVVMLLATMPAQAARLALVIGLDNYDAIPPLRNAAADAQAMAKALRDVGYDHVQVVQPRRTLRELQDDIRTFAARVNKGDELLFFFSGHGVQLGGENYLLPSDVRAQNEAQVRDDALALSRVLSQLRDLPSTRAPAFTLAIIDACRDNPFPSLGKNIGGRGLTGVAGANGQMVVYAAGEGQQALDRLPNDPPGVRNGVFTRVFLERMRQPGVPVQTVLRQVRQEVVRLARTVKHDQVPALYDQVVGDFYFVPPADRTSSAVDMEAESWALCRDGRTALPCQRYLERYASGRFVVLAKTRIEDFQVALAPSPRPQSVSLAQPAPQQAAMQHRQIEKDCDECPEMVMISAGEFVMGSPISEPERRTDEGPQRKVKISQRFAMSKYEITQAEWRALMGNNPSSSINCGEDCPVDNVSWRDAQEFTRRLSLKTGQTYRLPTEAEWEYAARAGTTTPFSTGRTISTSDANFDGASAYNGGPVGESNRRVVKVGSYAPNPFGLHDMHGNVREWVQDCFDISAYERPAANDGRAFETPGCALRSLRGGSSIDPPWWLRSAYRSANAADQRLMHLGFRVAKTLP